MHMLTVHVNGNEMAWVIDNPTTTPTLTCC
jgi:hypothetical protein